MADDPVDLVVREWDHTDWQTWGTCTAEHNAVILGYRASDMALAESIKRERAAVAERDALSADLEKVQTELDTLDHDFDVAQGEWVIEKAGLKAQLAAMTAERDEWAHSAAGRALAASRAQLTTSEAARVRMHSALNSAAAVFRHYEKLHLEKEPPDPDKATRNKDMAYVCERAMTLADAPLPATDGHALHAKYVDAATECAAWKMACTLAKEERDDATALLAQILDIAQQADKGIEDEGGQAIRRIAGIAEGGLGR